MIGLKKMSAWPFLIFALLFAMLVCLHFYLAYRAWQGSREEQGFDIDPEYVRMEDYFARSFRLKVAEWLKLPPLSLAPDGGRVIRKGRELIQVSGRADYPPRSRSDDILVVQGPFAGVAGIFVRYGARGRVVVNIEALGQYAGVEVSEDDIEIIPKILT